MKVFTSYSTSSGGVISLIIDPANAAPPWMLEGVALKELRRGGDDDSLTAVFAPGPCKGTTDVYGRRSYTFSGREAMGMELEFFGKTESTVTLQQPGHMEVFIPAKRAPLIFRGRAGMAAKGGEAPPLPDSKAVVQPNGKLRTTELRAAIGLVNELHDRHSDQVQLRIGEDGRLFARIWAELH